MAVAVIIWIVYITDATLHQKPLKTVQSAVHKPEKIVEAAAVTPSEPKQSDSVTISTKINDAIDRVGFLCCLTTMLFFAAPLSNLVSLIHAYYLYTMYLDNFLIVILHFIYRFM